jgi:SynChlorMet cassette radical SAM/SPASM protein ScmF
MAEEQYKLGTIYFYLTEGCNLCCRHCWIQPKYQEGEKVYPSLSLGLFKSIIEQAKPLGLSSVKLTGGEPLLHPQINEILEFIQKQELGLVVETNGILCTPELARKMRACKNPFVSVSIDAANAEIHEWVRQLEGSFEQALAGLKNLVQAGFRPQVIMTIMQQNKDQIEPLVRLAESLGAGSVKFNIVQPTSRGENMHKSGQTLTIQELVELGSWIENTLSKTAKIPLYYSHPPAFRPFSRMYGDKVNCGICGIMGILGVLSNGAYALCGIGEVVPEFIFGDAEKDKLEDIWNNTPMLCQIRQGLPKRLEGICGNCLMKNRCLGNCIAQNYYSTKNLWSSYWYCQEAFNKGLFPQTRIAPLSLQRA